MMTMHRLDNTGGVVTGDYARWLAEEQKSEAFTLKQQRLHREEAMHDTPSGADHSATGGGGGGGSGSNRKRGGGGSGGKAADAK